MARVKLPTVTLCAATSVNVSATVAALEHCLEQVDFAECLLFTDADVHPSDPRIWVEKIKRIGSSRAYSQFILEGLADHVRSSHCLVIQWDGFVLDAARWEAGFLDFDYVGAPWPQFGDGQAVGNGGFSLRSRKLLEACGDPGFRGAHPEDVAICRTNRNFLEQRHGIRFADRNTAARFAFERTAPNAPAFGFHGIFNMPQAIGVERFWSLYRGLDDRRTAAVDYRLLLRQLGRGRHSLRRRVQLTIDSLGSLFGRQVRQ